MYRQYLHHSKINHAGEALDDQAKEFILDTKITDEHKICQDALNDLYNPYFVTPLYIIVDT